MAAHASSILMALGMSALATIRAQEDARKTGYVVGRVVSLVGSPVAGARVIADQWQPDSKAERWVECTADAAGRFRIGPLATTPEQTLWAEGESLSRQRLESVPVFS